MTHARIKRAAPADNALLRRRDVLEQIHKLMERNDRHAPEQNPFYSDGFFDGLAELADTMTDYSLFQIEVIGHE